MNNDLLLSFREHNLMTNESIGIFTYKMFRIISYILWSDPSKVLLRFRGRKAVLCLPCLHVQSKFQLFWNYTITKLSVKKAKLTGWFARNCATILRVLILKIAFEPETFSAGAFEERAPGTFSLRLFLSGGGTPHITGVGMLVVSLRVVNFGFWSHLGCPWQNVIIFSREGLVQGCMWIQCKM